MGRNKGPLEEGKFLSSSPHLWNSGTLRVFKATFGSGQIEQADLYISIGFDRALAQGLAKATAH